jgi:Rrf2 family transcriptional regulator, repressor of oqxAB
MFEAELCKSPNFKWFGLALQALVVLSRQDDEPCPSHSIAHSVNSEATLLRRILSQLAAGGILDTREGRVGGYRLKRSAAEITLAEVYLALEAKDLGCSAMLESVGSNAFGQEMRCSFEEIVSRVNASTLDILREYTIADLTSLGKQEVN